MYDGDNWMWHSGWSGWVLMTVLMVVFWAVAITLVVMAIRYLSNGRVHSAGPTASQAQVLLANRYARGEIDDDEYRQRRFQPAGQAQVRVMEDGGEQQQGLEGEDRQEGKAQQQDGAGPGGGRDQHLAEMKAERRGRIQGPVEVMHEMEAPEGGPAVIGPVPPIDQEIEQQEIQRQARPALPPGRTPGQGLTRGQRRQG